MGSISRLTHTQKSTHCCAQPEHSCMNCWTTQSFSFHIEKNKAEKDPLSGFWIGFLWLFYIDIWHREKNQVDVDLTSRSSGVFHLWSRDRNLCDGILFQCFCLSKNHKVILFPCLTILYDNNNNKILITIYRLEEMFSVTKELHLNVDGCKMYHPPTSETG